MDVIKSLILTNKNKQYKINVFIFLLIIYTIFIIINDYCCLIFGIQGNVGTYIASLVLTLGITVLVLRKVKIEKDLFSKYDLLFFGIFVFIFAIKYAIPDKAFDTLNYHLYIGERTFTDNTGFNFFPSRWINTFSFPLADRMHYFIRSIFGYRLGISLNLYIVITIYYQLKRLLEKFIKPKRKIVIPIFATLILITEFILQNFITYYVDLFAIPFFLEIVILIFDKEFNDFSHILALLLAGIILALKISNAFILIPLAIIYIVLARKTLNVKSIIIGLICAALPILPYIINNYLQTGNPVFPFYNSIFKSQYLSEENWIEGYYGPKTIKERLLWPIYILKYPRRAHDVEFYYGRISFGYIASFILLIYSIVKKEKNLSFITGLNILLCLIWSNFMMGYIRYAIILEVLAGLVISLLIYEFLKDEKIYKEIIAVGITCLLIYQVYNSIYSIVFTSNELSWRKTFINDGIYYLRNVKRTFKRDNYKTELEGIDCFAITDYNAGYAVLLSDEIPTISLLESYDNEYGKNKFEEMISQYKDKRIFVISTSETIERTIKYLNTTNFKITGEIKTFSTDFLSFENRIILMEVTSANDIENNTVNIIKSEEENLIVKNDDNVLSLYYGNYPTLINSGNDGYDVMVDLLDEKGNIIETRKIDEIDEDDLFKQQDINIDNNNCSNIKIYFSNESTKNNYNDYLTLINVE